jgi:hypothetical protein
MSIGIVEKGEVSFYITANKTLVRNDKACSHS